MNLAKRHPRCRKAHFPSFEWPVELEFSSSLKIRFRSSLQANKNNAMTFGSKGSRHPTLCRGPPVFPATNDDQGAWPERLQESFDLISTQIQMNAGLEGAQLQATNQVGKKTLGKTNRHWRFIKRQCIRHRDRRSYSDACSEIPCQ